MLLMPLSRLPDLIKLIDGSGLVHITDECYQLFLSIERAICRHIQHHEIKDSEVFKNTEKIVTSDDSVSVCYLTGFSLRFCNKDSRSHILLWHRVIWQIAFFQIVQPFYFTLVFFTGGSQGFQAC